MAHRAHRLTAFCTATLLAAGSAAWLAACTPADKPKAQVAAPKPALPPAPKRVLIVGTDATAIEEAKKFLAGAQLEVKVAAKAGDKTDDKAEAFTLANLLTYRTVMLVGGKADALNGKQRAALENFVQSGGGLAAIGTETGGWNWFRRMNGDLDAARVLGKETAPKPTMVRAFDGGRVFVPAAGDADLAKGLAFVTRAGEPAFSLDPEARRPSDDYFESKELANNLEDPMGITVLPGGRVLILERLGAVKLFTPGQGVRTLTTLKVDAVGPGHRGDGDWYEGGGLGIVADPDFGVKNDFVYIYYSTPAKGGPDAPGKDINRLSRFRLVDGETLAYETPILDVPDDRGQKACHEGGSLCFGANRLLFLSAGDNTCPFASDGYAPIDERPGRFRFDAQRTSGNMNDLRGGISRIRINETGDGYTIPNGNLFQEGTPKTRRELFVKGCRNVWRIAYDSKTGGVAWGDVGPDAGGTNNNRGPVGYDFIGFAPNGGYFGWPYARGPVNDYKNVHDAWYTRHDFATGKDAECFADGIKNTSPNNTGPETPPKVQQSLVWYRPSGGTAEFPEMGGGGRTACVSVIYNQENRAHSFPKWFNHVLISHEWTRARLDFVKLADGAKPELETIQPFLGGTPMLHPVHMAQDPEGNLYFLEYGGAWTNNKNGRLSKISFKGWNRAPIIKLDATERFGGLATNFAFNAQADTAEDNPFTATWDFGDGAKGEGLKVAHTYAKSGRYEAKITVKDDVTGAAATRTVPVSAGNSYPALKVSFPDAPATLPWGGEVKVAARADDAEDGDLSASVQLTAQFGVPFDQPLPDPRLAGLDPALPGTKLMAANGCVACHTALAPNVGPAYAEVAKHYKDDKDFTAKLTTSITTGSTGKWNSHMAMPAFTNLSKKEVADLVAAIHSLANPSTVALTVENGAVKLPKERPAGIPANAVLTVRAMVTDKGAPGLVPLTAHADSVFKEKK